MRECPILALDCAGGGGRDCAGASPPSGGDRSEKQSFFWFHDHRMDHTGSNVYKGMVGLYPVYDPEVVPGYVGGFDMGDENQGLRLPGVLHDSSCRPE